MMLKWPHIQAELYRVFLNRVRANFHLVLQYTPTGGGFREKLAKHKELLYLSQMTFFADLPAAELEALGRGFFKLEDERAANKAIIENRAPKANQYSMTGDSDAQERVLSCIVKMYLQAQEMTKRFAEDQGQILYMTPTMFLRVFNCYKKLLKERQVVVKDISGRYEAGLEKIR
jgi:dynein heavy chain